MQLLVFGSSVSTGSGASDETQGWAHLLSLEAARRGFSYVNCGVGGTNVEYWNDVLNHGLKDELPSLPSSDVVILSLSLANEGLPCTSTAEERTALETYYLEKLRCLAIGLRRAMKPGARLVIGGPYPNNAYSMEHLEVLKRVWDTMKTWDSVDHFIDFLQPVVHDGRGHWHPGAWEDDSHPNDLGHRSMYQCLDIDSILGSP
eukprot:s2360_g5.t1